MNTTNITTELNSLVLPVISVGCQIILALVLVCIKKLEHNNYLKLNQMQETILDTVSKSGQMSTSRTGCFESSDSKSMFHIDPERGTKEAIDQQQQNEPYESESEPASTHRDIQLNNDFILRIKK